MAGDFNKHRGFLGPKKSGLVELSRASRFSRSLARLASGKFQLVSSPEGRKVGGERRKGGGRKEGKHNGGLG